ncbi:kinetochore Sim4 complex subunit FTA2-domain-containing protein [Apiospora phragmitis]|uniref:Kinetochore Sim4 complex subunit FTA2-domain-containing protein n=1 Tax=Apiospora phragmitis TaxID=2905665 RepID=A0ABR1VGU4_9PEZI
MAALPKAMGPKLMPFGKSAEERCHIDFIKQLGQGFAGYVWKVRIDGDVYALKMRLLHFRRFHKEREECGYTEHDINAEKSQFSRESRAYGRLKECDREDLSIMCHGYMQLDETHEKELAKKGTYDWNRRDDEQEPIMAIVKEYIDVPDKAQDEVHNRAHNEPPMPDTSWHSEHEEDEDEVERRLEEYWFQMRKLSWQNKEHLFQESDIPQMMEDLHSLHKLGIWVGDIKPDNYLHGKIIDFSSSLTMPAFSMDPRIHGHSSSTGGTFDRAELNHIIREYYKCCRPEKENKYEMVIKPRYQTRSRYRRQYSAAVTDPAYYGLYSDGTPQPVKRRKTSKSRVSKDGAQPGSNTKQNKAAEKEKNESRKDGDNEKEDKTEEGKGKGTRKTSEMKTQ